MIYTIEAELPDGAIPTGHVWAVTYLDGDTQDERPDLCSSWGYSGSMFTSIGLLSVIIDQMQAIMRGEGPA